MRNARSAHGSRAVGDPSHLKVGDKSSKPSGGMIKGSSFASTRSATSSKPYPLRSKSSSIFSAETVVRLRLLASISTPARGFPASASSVCARRELFTVVMILVHAHRGSIALRACLRLKHHRSRQWRRARAAPASR
ncbi:hypothetical protein BE221DRAFT_208887 [Ostreococcus tauri]|uniref:Uncharacterized protein n=1 Tax=Ostreococcus tauri TaxID=70448 RepID=A0A1Y5HZ34_OSTTA|nr:hypothetical protein BE221DRAFT_208887 [Ostreococcus tauri]